MFPLIFSNVTNDANILSWTNTWMITIKQIIARDHKNNLSTENATFDMFCSHLSCTANIWSKRSVSIQEKNTQSMDIEAGVTGIVFLRRSKKNGGESKLNDNYHDILIVSLSIFKICDSSYAGVDRFAFVIKTAILFTSLVIACIQFIQTFIWCATTAERFLSICRWLRLNEPLSRFEMFIKSILENPNDLLPTFYGGMWNFNTLLSSTMIIDNVDSTRTKRRRKWSWKQIFVRQIMAAIWYCLKRAKPFHSRLKHDQKKHKWQFSR